MRVQDVLNQPLIGLVGRSGSGKTHLMARLLPMLKAQGLTISTIKHTHHRVDIDKPGKDSFIHRQAGAHEVMLATPERWVLQHTPANNSMPELPDLLLHMAPVDLILVEGFHATVPVTIEVYRPEVGKAPFFQTHTTIAAVATTQKSCVPPGLVALDLEDIASIATYIVGAAQPLHIA
ncbi:molybdopterin-guanine dinucleotide biosynthesis protein B [Acetobacter orientalis]|uniref:molybdopterin-guanine dinucleotide biosynthesis protein B n=1 Tax=Acetobacter orientalis TaxID=146474 RepID=UPI0039EC98D3